MELLCNHFPVSCARCCTAQLAAAHLKPDNAKKVKFECIGRSKCRLGIGVTIKKDLDGDSGDSVALQKHALVGEHANHAVIMQKS